MGYCSRWTREGPCQYDDAIDTSHPGFVSGLAGKVLSHCQLGLQPAEALRFYESITHKVAPGSIIVATSIINFNYVKVSALIGSD